MPCEWPKPRQSPNQLSQATSHPISSSPSSEGSFSLPTELSEETTVLPITDLRLIHHWTLYAYKGFGSNATEEVFWQKQLPLLGHVYPFLMHIILSISSLHLAQHFPEKRKHFETVAASHHDAALPAYRYVIKDLEANADEQRGRAMVSFASLTAVYALLCPTAVDDQSVDNTAPIVQLCESFLLLRGAREVLAVVGDCTEGCTMSSQLQALYGDVDFSLYPEDPRLAALQMFIEETMLSKGGLTASSQAVVEALYCLRWCFAMVHDPTSDIDVKRAINLWIESVPQSYIGALQDLQPIALIVLAHWCIMLHQARIYWYLQGSAAKVLSAIRNILDERWQAEIGWPLECIEING